MAMSNFMSYLLYQITFPGVAEMVLDRLAKPSGVDFIMDTSKENLIKLFGRKQRRTSIIHLISDSKAQRTGKIPWKMVETKRSFKKFCLTYFRNLHMQRDTR